jgi:ABC-type phosphate transport system substrate-binding protein
MHLLPVLIPLVATFIGMVGAIFSVLVAGSTAFAPSVAAVAQRLRQDCPSSIVQTNPGGSTVGSLGAASDLEDSGSSAAVRATHLVISDGAVPAAEYTQRCTSRSRTRHRNIRT